MIRNELDEIKVGDKYRGLINNAIFEIIEVNKKDGFIKYKVDGHTHFYGLKAFKRCYLEKIN